MGGGNPLTMQGRAAVAACFCATLFGLTATATASPLDRTFGRNGFSEVGFGEFEGYQGVRDMAVGPHGEIAVVTGDYDFTLTKFTAAGKLDKHFSGDGRTSASLGPNASQGSGVAFQPNGKLLVAGTSYVPDSHGCGSRATVARFLPSGRLDPAFGKRGFIRFTRCSRGNLIELRDRQIYLTGALSRPRKAHREVAFVARLRPDGVIDGRFGGGIVRLARMRPSFAPAGPSAVDVGTDGRVLVALRRPRKGATLFELNDKGRRRAKFGPHGVISFPRSDGRINSVALAPKNRVRIAIGQRIRGFRSNGSVDRAFGTAGVTSLPEAIEDIAVDGAGRISAVGGSEVFRLGPRGAVNTDFTTAASSKARRSTFLRVALAPKHKVVAAGVARFHSIGIGEFDARGAPVALFGQHRGFVKTSPRVPTYDEADALSIQPNGSILVAGRQDQEGIVAAALRPDGALDKRFGRGGHLSVDTYSERGRIPLAFQGRDLLVRSTGPRNTDDLGVTRFHGGRLDKTFGISGRTGVKAERYTAHTRRILVMPNARILAVGTEPGMAYVARYLRDGRADPTFGHLRGFVRRAVGGGAIYPSVRDFDFSPGQGLLVTMSYEHSIRNTDGVFEQDEAGTLFLRLRRNGGLVRSFGRGGVVRLKGTAASAAALGRDGSVTYGGARCRTRSPVKCVRGGVVGRLKADGTPSPSFGGDGTLLYRRIGEVTDVERAPGGLTTLVGEGGGQLQIGVLDATGRPDARFGGGFVVPRYKGRPIYYPVADIARGKLVIAATSNTLYGSEQFLLMRFRLPGG